MKTTSIVWILAKDLRRFWPLLGLTAALGFFVNFAAFNVGATISLDVLNDGAYVCQWFLIGLCSVAVVQDDSVSGERGAWLARPMSATSVLMAKLAFIWIGLALPASVTIFCAACSLHCSWEVTVAETFIHGGWIGIAGMGFALLGSLTTSVLRAAVVLIACALGVGLSGHVYELYVHAWMERVFPPDPIPLGSFPPPLVSGVTMSCVAIPLILVSGAGMLGYHYRHRNRARALALLAIPFAGFCLTVKFWRWDFVPRRERSSLEAKESPGIEFAVYNPRAYLASAYAPILGLQMKMSGGAEGMRYDVYRSQSRYIPVNGAAYTMPFLCGWESRPINDENLSEAIDPSLLAALGAPHDPRAARVLSVGVLELPQPVFDSLRGTSGRLEANVQLQALRPVLLARLPLAPGEKTGDRGRFWRIRSMRYMPDGYVGVTLLSAELAFPVLDPVAGNGLDYVLVNRTRAEFSPVASQVSQRNRRTDLINSLQQEQIFHVRHSLTSAASAEGIDPDWMENAELEIFGNQFVGMTQAAFTVDGMIMPGAPSNK